MYMQLSMTAAHQVVSFLHLLSMLALDGRQLAVSNGCLNICLFKLSTKITDLIITAPQL